MTNLYLQNEYVTTNCGATDHGGCGTSFAMTREFYDEMRRTKKTWYCPKGHSRVFGGKTTEQQLKDAQSRETALVDQLSASTRDAEEMRVALLRDRQRFAKGVCPCCNRSFENVRRHMGTQHPEYDVTKVKQATAFKCSCGSSFDSFHGLRIHQGRSRRPLWDSPTADRWSSHLTRV